MKPMLLTEYRDKIDLINSQPYVFVQPKLDGHRAMINTKTEQIFSRSGKEIKLPHITKEILSISDLPEWLDGELYTHGFTLGQISGMIRKQDERIIFNCFDVVSDEGFQERFCKKDWTIKNPTCFKFVETRILSTFKIKMYYDYYVEKGYEGLVIRLDNMPYQQYRTEQVIKLKPECEV
jgi:ATP-dependent DNA ligase